MTNTKPSNPNRGLGDRTARGFSWVLAQTLTTKMAGTLGQIPLAWLLAREDFGLIGLAYTVTALTDLLQRIGLREILIHRRSQYRRWANAAFWMSLASGLGASVILFAVAPLASLIYDSPKMTGLLWVLALATPVTALTNVPEAKLQSQMRFRLLAGLGAGTNVSRIVLTILFAWLGFGAYSFAIPRPIVAAGRFAVGWWAARPRVRWQLQVRRWRYLVPDSAKLFVANLFMTLTAQGDYIILGVFHDKTIVGLYFFAYNLSIQTLSLFTQNFSRVLFPALSTLQDDPERQTRAFLRASRLLALMGVPACLLQAALADPGIRALFQEKWYDSIAVLQILSVGMAFRVISSSSASLIQAQGRFTTKLVTNIAYGCVFMLIVTVAAQVGEQVSVAIGVASYNIVVGLVHMYVAIRTTGGRWRDIWGVFAAPLSVGVVAVGSAVVVADLLPPMPGRPWVRIGVTMLWGGSLYLLFIRWVAADSCEELRQRFRLFGVRKRSAQVEEVGV